MYVIEPFGAPRSDWALRNPAASAGSLDPAADVEEAAQLVAGKQFQQAPCLAPSTRWSSISDEKIRPIVALGHRRAPFLSKCGGSSSFDVARVESGIVALRRA